VGAAATFFDLAHNRFPDLDGLAKELVTEYGGLDLPK